MEQQGASPQLRRCCPPPYRRRSSSSPERTHRSVGAGGGRVVRNYLQQFRGMTQFSNPDFGERVVGSCCGIRFCIHFGMKGRWGESINPGPSVGSVCCKLHAETHKPRALELLSASSSGHVQIIFL